MLFLKQPIILSFLCHKSATTCQIDSNSKLTLYLCNCVKTDIIECTVPPELAHKQGTIFFGHPVHRASQTKFTSLADDGIKNTRLTFNSKKSVYQSKAISDVKFF